MLASEESRCLSVKTLAEDLLYSLSLQRSEGRFCDVQLTDGVEKIWAHSCVLSIFSPFMMRYFIKYLDELIDWSVNKPIQLNISSLTKCWGESKNNCMNCVLNTVDYIYTGKIKLTLDHVDHIVNLSNNLELENLLLICNKYKKDNNTHLKTENVLKSDKISTVDISFLNSHNETSTKNLSNSENVLSDRIVFNISLEDLKTVSHRGESNVSVINKQIVILPGDLIQNKTNNNNNNNTNNANSNIYSCEVCGFISYDDEQFLIHDFVFHRYDYTCLSCKFEDRSINKTIEHLQTEIHDITLCSICLQQTNEIGQLKIHLEEHKNVKPFKCTNCSIRFENRGDWLKHFVVNCGTKPKNIDESVKKDPDDYTTKESCSLCKFSFPSELKARKHHRVFHKNKYTCLSCDYNTYKIEKLVLHLNTVPHKETDCSLCLYEGKTKPNLKNHLNEHLDKLPFKCSVCLSKYPNRRQWWRHMASHFNEKPFKCPHCQLAFKNTVLLNTHILRMHKSKKYVCSICGLAAPFPSLLEKHQKIHKTQKPEYICPADGCSFKTKLKKLFKKHRKEEHSSKIKPKENKKEPLKCSICKLTFSMEKNLKRHIKLKHDSFAQKFQCPKCNYTSVRLDKLKYHILNIHHDFDVRELNDVLKTVKNNFPQVLKSNLILPPPKIEAPPLPRIEDVEEVISKSRNTQNTNKNTILNNTNNEITMNEGENMLFEQISNSEATNNVEKTFSQMDTSVLKDLSCDIQGMERDITKIENDLQEIEKKENTKSTEMLNSCKSPVNHLDKYMNETNNIKKKTLFLNKTTGEINILSADKGKPIPIASVTSTNLLTIGNFREGTGSVTLNETTGVLTLNNINSGSTGAVFLNESTGELSYIDLNRENKDESKKLEIPSTSPFVSEQVKLNINELGFELAERFQLDEFTGEIIKLDKENKDLCKEGNREEDVGFEDFDFDIGTFNDDSIDGFDDFDEMIFDNLTDNTSDQGEDEELNKSAVVYPPLVEQMPRLDEMTGEFTFDETSNTQDVWNELKPFRDIDDVGDDSIMENVNNGSYNYLLNEITGEFYH